MPKCGCCEAWVPGCGYDENGHVHCALGNSTPLDDRLKYAQEGANQGLAIISMQRKEIEKKDQEIAELRILVAKFRAGLFLE